MGIRNAAHSNAAGGPRRVTTSRTGGRFAGRSAVRVAGDQSHGANRRPGTSSWDPDAAAANPDQGAGVTQVSGLMMFISAVPNVSGLVRSWFVTTAIVNPVAGR